jgi:hypothetical protein
VLPPDRLRTAAARLEEASEAGSLDTLLLANGVEALFVHGSVIDLTVAEPGDLDVAVWCGGDGPRDLLDLLGCLTEAAGAEIDLAVLDRAPVTLVASAVTARALWESRPGLVAALQMRFVPQVWDTAWLRRARLEQLAGR